MSIPADSSRGQAAPGRTVATVAATAVTRPLERRGLLLGAGAVGAAALAVKVMPGAAPLAPVEVAAKKAIAPDGGYQLTAHVQRYYDTARS
ncbi:hypothetical protein BH11PSE8_BH11PSE8_16520 [soil metagenome]